MSWRWWVFGIGQHRNLDILFRDLSQLYLPCSRPFGPEHGMFPRYGIFSIPNPCISCYRFICQGAETRPPPTARLLWAIFLFVNWNIVTWSQCLTFQDCLWRSGWQIWHWPESIFKDMKCLQTCRRACRRAHTHTHTYTHTHTLTHTRTRTRSYTALSSLETHRNLPGPVLLTRLTQAVRNFAD